MSKTANPHKEMIKRHKHIPLKQLRAARTRPVKFKIATHPGNAVTSALNQSKQTPDNPIPPISKYVALEANTEASIPSDSAQTTQASKVSKDSQSSEDSQFLKTPEKLILRYRYIKLLGEGSNGKTYLAKARRTDADVAIKALKLVQNDTYKSFELFKREAETLASIKVQGVPKFYESILSDLPGGECYIIQEYIHAPSIQSYIDKGWKFSELETMLLLLKITQILEVLHTQYSPPIIHRDIKPSNILCQLPESNDINAWKSIKPYLIDFGAVANANSNSDKSTIAGTVGYMAPEQNFGECLPQTDFYALGATALHMLTGKPPYEMEYETYSLKFEQYLDELAPKTSAPTRALLKSLLSYTTNERPENAIELTQKIREILYAPKAPVNHNQPPKSFFGRISYTLKHFNDRLNQISFMQKHQALIDPQMYYLDLRPDHPNCKITYGTLWTNTFFDYLQYTFTANGKIWLGASNRQIICVPCDTPIKPPYPMTAPKPLSECEHQFIRQVPTVPCPCVVLYHAKDPSCNLLHYLLIEREVLAKLVMEKQQAREAFLYDGSGSQIYSQDRNYCPMTQEEISKSCDIALERLGMASTYYGPSSDSRDIKLDSSSDGPSLTTMEEFNAQN